MRLASSKSSTTIACDRGLYSEGFRMTALPQIRGTATARSVRRSGAFHGAIESLPPVSKSRVKSDVPTRFPEPSFAP